MQSKGSALLLVILITLILSVLTLGSWYKSSLFFDLVVQREKYYKNFYLTEAVLNFGIKITKGCFEDFLKPKTLQKMPITLDLSFLVEKVNENKQNLSAKLIINKIQKGENVESKLWLVASLQEINTKKILCELSCLLIKCEDKSIVVSQRKNKADTEHYDKKTRFIVENFTIGNFV